MTGRTLFCSSSCLTTERRHSGSSRKARCVQLRVPLLFYPLAAVPSDFDGVRPGLGQEHCSTTGLQVCFLPAKFRFVLASTVVPPGGLRLVGASGRFMNSTLIQPRPINLQHPPLRFARVAPVGPAVAGRPPGLAGGPGGDVDPAGRSVGLPSATPVPHPALTGGSQNKQIFRPKA